MLEAVLAAGADGRSSPAPPTTAFRLDAARAIGAHEVIDVTTTDAVARVRELTGGRMADVVMDISPAVDTVPLALDLVAFRGTVLLAGLKHFAPVDGIVTDQIVLQGLRVFGGSGYTPASMATAVDLINTGESTWASSAARSSGSTRSTRLWACSHGRFRAATPSG